MIADAIRQEPAAAAYDLARVRADFPILAQEIYGNPLSFLDSAASAQKPRQVIDAVAGCYETQYANIHRGVYYLSERTTEAFEGAQQLRRTVHDGIGRLHVHQRHPLPDLVFSVSILCQSLEHMLAAPLDLLPLPVLGDARQCLPGVGSGWKRLE